MSQQRIRKILLSALAAALCGAAAAVPSHALARAGHAVAARRPATMAYSFPEQCVVLAVQDTPFVKARGLLATLGCRSRRVERTSALAKGLVISVVGGERSYAFGHTVTLIVSSGPSQST